jgi:hypothetical protein
MPYVYLAPIHLPPPANAGAPVQETDRRRHGSARQIDRSFAANHDPAAPEHAPPGRIQSTLGLGEAVIDGVERRLRPASSPLGIGKRILSNGQP